MNIYFKRLYDTVETKLFKNIFIMSKRPSSDMSKFLSEFTLAKHIVVLTGAGVSAESGIPTFRGSGGLWRKFKAQDLATPVAFGRDPSLVWEFYHHRREVVLTKEPNQAHIAIAKAQKRLKEEGKHLAVITQNIDELHRRAGADDVTELHGSLFKTRCTDCHLVLTNTDSPICPSLEGKGEPNLTARDAAIPEKDLPRCHACGGLLRPHVVWFGEGLDADVLSQADNELKECDLCLVVGTSSVVYPAAMFAPELAARGCTVAEFNVEPTPVTRNFGYYFEGPCGSTLPVALAP